MNNKNNQLDAIKEAILLKIFEGAEYYEKNLVSRNFLIIAKGKTWEIECNSENFLHLCGVATNLNPRRFYTKALNKALDKDNIFFNARFSIKHAKEKMRVMINVFKGFKESSHLLTEILVEQRISPFPVGLDLQTEDGGTLCFVKDNKNHLVPSSLRANIGQLKRHKGDYPIDYILSKRYGEKEYAILEYGDLNTLEEYLSKRNLLDLPINKNSIKESIDMHNNYDSKIELEVQNKEKSIKFTARNIDAKTLGDFIKSSNIIDKVLEDEKSAEDFSRD